MLMLPSVSSRLATADKVREQVPCSAVWMHAGLGSAFGANIQVRCCWQAWPSLRSTACGNADERVGVGGCVGDKNSPTGQ